MADQAQALRDLIWKSRERAHVITITSGKGGVGKTSTSVNLAIALASRRHRVIIFDADLGLANVEVLLGLSSSYNIAHVLDGSRSMEDILVRGPGGIEVVPGSSGLAHIADLDDEGRFNILRGLESLQGLADFLIIDTMAGIGANAVTFAAAADEVLLITTPEPSSIVDAYAMLKSIHYRQEDTPVRLIVNMVSGKAQAQAVANKLANVSRNYLKRNFPYLGYLPRDPAVSQSVMQSQPFILKYPGAPVSKCMHALAARLLHHQTEFEPLKESFFKRFVQSLGLATNG